MQGNNKLRKILWIHGWGMSPEIWRTQIHEWLGDARHEGQSTHGGQGCGWEHHFFSYVHCHSIDAFMPALQKTMRVLQPHAVVGWSLGGMLALEWLQMEEHEADDTLERVVIVGSTLRFVDSDRNVGWPRRTMERMRDRLKLEPNTVLKQFALSMLTQKERSEGAVDDRLQMPDTDFSAKGLESGLTYLIDSDLRCAWRTKLAIRVAEQRIKILWLHGSDDPICPIGAMPMRSEGFETSLLPGAGHIPFITQPTAFFGQLKGFLYDDQDR